jgi:endogenous inhibitor of DNA gyrase (YacG/DUF329 family)
MKCPICDKEFVPQSKALGQKYCSNRCNRIVSGTYTYGKKCNEKVLPKGIREKIRDWKAI